MSTATEVRYCQCGLPMRDVYGTRECVHCDRLCQYNNVELCDRCKAMEKTWKDRLIK